jgi:hypothetical protein
VTVDWHTERFFAALRMTLGVTTVLVPLQAAAQVSGQSFEVTPEVASATVGDSVTLRFRVSAFFR